jgi:hypothetical protein
MKTLGGCAVVLLAVTGLSAQNRTGFVNPGNVVRTFPNAVYPGGTSAIPGVIRTTGNVLYPGGGGPQIAVPSPVMKNPGSLRNGFSGFGTRNVVRRNNGGGIVAYPIAYPVYVGGYADPYSMEFAAPAAQQPNITIIMPPQQAPMVVNPFVPGAAQDAASLPAPVYEPAPATQPLTAAEPTHYLIAFKDHTIYPAIAYWVDGDTLHYFTSGNTHNQASVSLIDRELTERLNRESGVEVKLPAAK